MCTCEFFDVCAMLCAYAREAHAHSFRYSRLPPLTRRVIFLSRRFSELADSFLLLVFLLAKRDVLLRSYYRASPNEGERERESIISSQAL